MQNLLAWNGKHRKSLCLPLKITGTTTNDVKQKSTTTTTQQIRFEFFYADFPNFFPFSPARKSTEAQRGTGGGGFDRKCNQFSILFAENKK